MDNAKKYTTLDMPMSVFMNAYCDGDMSEVDNFSDVLIDYHITIGGDELQQDLEKKVKTLTKENRFLAGKLCVQILKSDVALELKLKSSEDLTELGFNSNVEEVTAENLQRYTAHVEGSVNLLGTRIEMEKLEAEKPEVKQGAVKQDRNYFTTRMVAINSALNLNISDSSSARMFCCAANQFKIYRLNKETQTEQL